MKSSKSHIENRGTSLEADTDWFLSILDQRTREHLNVGDENESRKPAPIPDLGNYSDPYASLVSGLKLSPAMRVILVLSLLPTMDPEALDMLRLKDANGNGVTAFGGHLAQVHKGFIPTIETALFLLAGRDKIARLLLMQEFGRKNPLFRSHWLKLEQVHPNEPFATAQLLPTRDLIDYITTGRLGAPEFGASFPAERIETSRTWDDLVLPHETVAEVQDLLQWIKLEGDIMEGMGLHEKVSPGYRALFHGPPGTGKTLTASLLGKATGRDVYRIDLSMVVSKYIGETEKNLKVVFDKAQSRGWILFFDEADALFGKRTDVSDSKDRYANQEVSYLLQRVENFDGIVILATNNRDNMDKAFTRRFQSVIHFPMPGAAERLLLWEKAFPDTYNICDAANLPGIAERFEIAGGNIINVVRHCALRAAMRGVPTIEEVDILEGIRKEYKKAGKIMH